MPTPKPTWKQTFGGLDKDASTDFDKSGKPSAKSPSPTKPTPDTFASRPNAAGAEPATHSPSSSPSSTTAADLTKLKGRTEIDGGIVPKSADEAAAATGRQAVQNNQHPKLVTEEDPMHRDEWGSAGSGVGGVKSKM